MDQRFSIKHIILAVFHKSMLVKDSFNLALAVKKRLDTTFITSPIILPGDGAPPDIPRVIFKAENGMGLHVMQNATQLDIRGEGLTEKTLYEFLSIGNEVVSLVSEDFECEIARIGIVLVGNLALETTGAEFIKETYLKGYDEQLFGSEVHWLTNPVMGSEKINRWVRIKSDADLNGDANRFVQITIDSNIMHMPERTVSGDLARDYIKMWIDDLHDNFSAIAKINL